MIYRNAEKQLKSALKSNKVVVITGARQVGKTTLVSNLLNKQALMLNFDVSYDIERFKLASKLMPEQAFKLFGEPEYLVIDEAQRIPETSRIIKGWYDIKFPAKMLLLGSSSLNLLSQTSESLMGRNEKIQIYPLAINEILTNEPWYKSEYTYEIIEKYFIDHYQHSLLKAIVFGGYPEVVTTDKKEKLLIDLSNDYLWKDVLQSGMIKTPDLIRKLLMLLAYQIGSEISTNELATQLHIARQTVERYIELLEQTFVIFSLSSYCTNPRKEISKKKKIYFYDTGIRNALIHSFELNPQRIDIGNLFENFLIAEIYKRNQLRDVPYEMFFWRNVSQSEVDLVLKDGDNLYPYEIKWGNKKINTKAFMNSYGIETKALRAMEPSNWPLTFVT